MNNVVSHSPSSYHYSPATSGVSRRSSFVAHSHALTHTAKASRVYTSACAQVCAARPEKHLQALQATKPAKQAKQPFYPSNRPLAQANNAQAATEFIVFTTKTTTVVSTPLKPAWILAAHADTYQFTNHSISSQFAA
jgi:hypothetical protein